MDEIRRYSDAIEVQLSVAKNPTQPAKPKRNTTQRGPWLKGLFPKTGDTPGESGAWQLESDKQRARERRQQLLDSLSTHDYLTPLKQSRRKRHAGTAEWLFETEEFNEWINDLGFTVFWCSGKSMNSHSLR